MRVGVGLDGQAEIERRLRDGHLLAEAVREACDLSSGSTFVLASGELSRAELLQWDAGKARAPTTQMTRSPR